MAAASSGFLTASMAFAALSAARLPLFPHSPTGHQRRCGLRFMLRTVQLLAQKGPLTLGFDPSRQSGSLLTATRTRSVTPTRGASCSAGRIKNRG